MRNFYLIIFCISVASISTAIYIEHVLEYKPCKLCIYQRIPYIISIFISFLGYNYFKNNTWLYLLLIIFLSSSLLSGYHVGIENNFINEFSGCISDNNKIIDKSELLNSLKNTAPNCKEVDYRIFGLSLATINFIMSVIISVFITKFLVYEKNR